MDINFKCPSCGYNQIKIITRTFESNTITGISETGEIETGDEYFESTTNAPFECYNCEEPLKDVHGMAITDAEELAEWLELHKETT